MINRGVWVAMSFTIGLSVMCSAQAQSARATQVRPAASSTMQTGLPTGFSAAQTSTTHSQVPGSTPIGWQTKSQSWQENPTTGIGTFGVHAPAAKATTTTTTTTTTKSTKTKADLVTVNESPTNKSTALKWLSFDNWISLKQGQDQLPLTLTFTNGGEGNPPYQRINIMLSGRPVATEKNFDRNGRLAMDMNGALGPGDNQLKLQAFGPVGSTLKWKLTTPRPVLESGDPTSVGPGATLKLSGKNFSQVSSLDSVQIGGKDAAITAASNKQLTVTVPTGVEAGEQKVTLSVAGVEAKPIKIKVAYAQPEITACDMYSAPPGYTVTLTGKNFSAKASENVVTVSGVPAQVVSASPTSLQFVMPDINNIIGLSPVIVKTNGIAAKGNVNIMVSRAMPYDGTSTGVTQ